MEPATADTLKQQPVQISADQVQAASAAALEVLNGAPTSRVLALTVEIGLAKMLLNGIVRGDLALTQKPAGAATPPTPNRKERRAAAAESRRTSGPGK